MNIGDKFAIGLFMLSAVVMVVCFVLVLAGLAQPVIAENGVLGVFGSMLVGLIINTINDELCNHNIRVY